jgi:hypothetical protein
MTMGYIFHYFRFSMPNWVGKRAYQVGLITSV